MVQKIGGRCKPILKKSELAVEERPRNRSTLPALRV